MAFHKVHCPRCGRTMLADELAFDFGEIINIALTKAKERTFGKSEEWYDLTKLNLRLYLSLNDLIDEYDFKYDQDGTYKGHFKFTTTHLAKHIVKLAASTDPNMSIQILASSTNMVEYEKLTNAMAKSGDVDKMELAEKIQELANQVLRNPNVQIAAFQVTVNMQRDDQNNNFANRLLVKFDDGENRNITRFVCKGESGKPCGKVLYGHAGQFKEIIIGLAGTARVGKTAYLASLLATIMRQGNGIENLGNEQTVVTNLAYADEAYDRFKKDLLDPYVNCEKIKKTENIFDKVGDTEAISLFSLTFSINNRQKYIFTFIDMPGEVYDDGIEGANEVINNRQIITEASMIWLCIAPAQVEGGAVIAGGDQVNTDLGKAFANLERTMAAINKSRLIPTAVLLTCSDLVDEKYGLFDSSFNPFASTKNPMALLNEKKETSPWVSEAGELYYSNMQWFAKKVFEYLKTNPSLPTTIENIFGKFTPFAVASYGKAIDNPYAMQATNNIPTPSMIEAPFLWTLAVLGLIPVYREEFQTYIRKEGIIFKRPVEYQVLENIPVDIKNESEKIFYYKRGN